MHFLLHLSHTACCYLQSCGGQGYSSLGRDISADASTYYSILLHCVMLATMLITTAFCVPSKEQWSPTC